MKKMFIIAISLMISACSTVTVRNSHKMPPVTPSIKGNNSFFIAGIAQESIIDALEVCGGRGYSFKTYYSFGDGVLAVITFGIYTPSSYAIYCDRVTE